MAGAYILFQVNNVSYAVPSDLVLWVDLVENVTFVPNAPRFVEGVVYRRGEVVPLINLRTLFGLEKIPLDLRARLLATRIDGRTIGLVVDSARDFLRLPAESIQPPPAELSGPGVEYLQGVLTWHDRLVLLINLPRLLSAHERDAVLKTALETNPNDHETSMQRAEKG